MAIVVIVVLVKRHRKKKRSAMDEQWDAWQDDQDGGNKPEAQGHASDTPAEADTGRQAPTEVIAPLPGERS